MMTKVLEMTTMTLRLLHANNQKATLGSWGSWGSSKCRETTVQLSREPARCWYFRRGRRARVSQNWVQPGRLCKPPLSQEIKEIFQY
eukprot:06212_6